MHISFDKWIFMCVCQVTRAAATENEHWTYKQMWFVQPLLLVGDIINQILWEWDVFAGCCRTNPKRAGFLFLSSAPSPSSAGSDNEAAVAQLQFAVEQVAYRLWRCEIGSGFNFSLFTILHTTTVKYKATEACQRRMVHTVISDWTVCHPVTAKVHKRLWSHGNKLERVHVVMYQNELLTTLLCSWISALVREDDSSFSLQDVCMFQRGSV